MEPVGMGGRNKATPIIQIQAAMAVLSEQQLENRNEV
jgi:hypothetical protein